MELRRSNHTVHTRPSSQSIPIKFQPGRASSCRKEIILPCGRGTENKRHEWKAVGLGMFDERRDPFVPPKFHFQPMLLENLLILVLFHRYPSLPPAPNSPFSTPPPPQIAHSAILAAGLPGPALQEALTMATDSPCAKCIH